MELTMKKFGYSIKWTQPYQLDYSAQRLYNQHEHTVEQLLRTSQMLEAKQLIDRIKQL